MCDAHTHTNAHIQLLACMNFRGIVISSILRVILYPTKAVQQLCYIASVAMKAVRLYSNLYLLTSDSQ